MMSTIPVTSSAASAVRQPLMSSASADRMSGRISSASKRVATGDEDIEKWYALSVRTSVEDRLKEADKIITQGSIDELRKLLQEIDETEWMFVKRS